MPPKTLNQQQLINKALNYLKFRPRSESEIRIYLEKHTNSHQFIDQAVEFLIQQKLINDSNFAQWLVNSRLKKGKGLVWCQKELGYKFQIKKSTVQTVLQAIDQDQVVQSAIKQLKKKHQKPFKNLSYQQSSKLKQHLYQRGYSSNIIRLAFDELKASE